MIKLQEVKPKSSGKILGVVIKTNQRYQVHVVREAAKSVTAALSLRRMKMTSLWMARQQLFAMASPILEYASNVRAQ